MRHLLYFFLLLTMGLFTACADNTTSEATEGDATESTEETISPSEVETQEVDKSGPEYTSAYICPMNCEGSGSAEIGTCPVCGMDYVANEDHPMHQGDNGSDQEGHDHDDHEGHSH